MINIFLIISVLLQKSFCGQSVIMLPSINCVNNKENKMLPRFLQNYTTSQVTQSIHEISKEECFSEERITETQGIFSRNGYDQLTQKNHDMWNFLQSIPRFDLSGGMVTEKCKHQSKVYRKELNNLKLWALKMYDSTAKIPSGLLNGNVNQFGDFDECINTEGSTEIFGQYCLVNFQIEVDESRPDLLYIHRLVHSHYAIRSNITDPGHRIPRFSTINWGICTPSSCSHSDIEISLQQTTIKYFLKLGIKLHVKVEPDMCQTRSTASMSTATILSSLLFLSAASVSAIAALCDHFNLPLGGKLLLAFSLKRNFITLISSQRSVDDIKVIHGIRAINALLLLIAHKSLALLFNPYTNRTELVEYIGQPWTVLGRAASLYTDPFIMLSGLLTSYSLTGKLIKYGKINIFKEYFCRFLRLMPMLIALILFCTYIMPYIGSGPQWTLVVTNHAKICKRTWWRNLLFIQNYFGFEDMCLTHTHHLGIDMQLFVFSPALVFILHTRRRTGVFILILVAMISTALRFYITYTHHLNNYVFFGISIQQLLNTANQSYILPTHRMTVYVLGVYLGYVLQQRCLNYKLSQKIILFGWTTSCVMALLSFIGPAGMGSITYIYKPIHAALYNAFAPIGWCSLFMWIVFMAHTENTNGWISKLFGWKGFIIFTKLSYSVYLTQFPVFFYNVGTTRASQYCNFLELLIDFKEMLWILFGSITLTLLFDIPFQNMKNVYLRNCEIKI